MKKHFTLIFTLFLLLLQISASAQGEWKWAHYWSGGDGSYGAYFNEITNTAFDEEGNIYVYGTMGGNPTIDGMTFQFINNGEVLSYNEKTILLAKFDTLGNMLWYKVVKSSSSPSFPLWMEVQNDKVYVAGNSSMYEDRQDSWLYYMDTLVRKWQVDNIPEEQQQFPFKPYHRWTFFTQLDLDGNLIEDHFVEAITRDYYFDGTDTVRHQSTLCENDISPVHICNDGSICVFTTIEYNESEERPYTIIVDGDTNKTYQLYFPGSTVPPANIWNAIEYKFTPDWELDFAKLLVDHTDGIAPIIVNGQDTIKDYFYLFFHGMTFDNDDNVYLTGRIVLGQCMPGSGGELNNFPVYIWWDDNHHTTMDDISSAEQCSFILKYNPMGGLLWNNQPHTLIQNSATDLALVDYWKSTFDDNSIYVLGDAGYNNNSHIYFDNPQQTLVQNNADSTGGISFFVRYNAATGEYQSHGIIPFPMRVTRKPAIMNDRVLAITWKDYHRELFLTTWRKDGTFIKNEKISDNSNVTYKSYGIQKKDDTHLAVLLQATGPQSLGDNIFLNCPSNLSSAVVAYYYDPSLAEPLPEDTTGIAEHSVKVNVRLWPNPATDKITIESEDAFPIKSVCIADMQGTIVGILPVDDTRCTLNVSNLSAGTYIAHVETAAGISDCKFVVKK